MLDFIKECTIGEIKRSYNETRDKIDRICGVGKDEIELDYLKEDEKRIHINMRKKLNDYISDEEEILIETVVSANNRKSSIFLTNEKMLTLTPLDMFQTGSKMSSAIFYYKDMNDIGLIENNRKYHTLNIKMEGVFGLMKMKMHPQISKKVFKLLNNKIKSGY